MKCDICGEKVTISHYHCPKCNKKCSMMGHILKDGTFYCDSLDKKGNLKPGEKERLWGNEK